MLQPLDSEIQLTVDKKLLLAKPESFRTKSSDVYREEKNIENIIVPLHTVQNIFCQYFNNITDFDIDCPYFFD